MRVKRGALLLPACLVWGAAGPIFCTGLEAPLLAGALFGRNLRRGAEPPPWSGIQERRIHYASDR